MMKAIKAVLVSTIFIFTTGQYLACGSSYQYRLFPIGATNDKLVIIETSLNRYWQPNTAESENRNRWKGTVTLKSLNQNGQLVALQQIDSVDISDNGYSDELKPYFDSAFSFASKLPDFKLAHTPTIEFCNFKEQCETIELTAPAINSMTIQTKEKEEIGIKLPKAIIEQSDLQGGIDNQEFKINSIRTMTVGDYELIVANFASGEEHNTEFERQTKNQKQCNSVKDCIYKEVTLYHGLSFDSVIWN